MTTFIGAPTPHCLMEIIKISSVIITIHTSTHFIFVNLVWSHSFRLWTRTKTISNNLFITINISQPIYRRCIWDCRSTIKEGKVNLILRISHRYYTARIWKWKKIITTNELRHDVIQGDQMIISTRHVLKMIIAFCYWVIRMTLMTFLS